MLSIPLATFSCGHYGDDVPVYFENGALNHIGEYMQHIKFDRIQVITDSIVSELYGDFILRELRKFCQNSTLIYFQHGEKNKTFEVYESLCEKTIPNVTRDSLIVAFGGGVVGNIAGLVAASVFRGIRFIHIPTTLIAQADSTLGIKQAINTSRGKNTVGAYYPPLMVINDPELLTTLSLREIECGLIESVKLGLSFSEEFVHYMEEKLKPNEAPSKKILSEIIQKNIELKVRILNQDPMEREFGLQLELGHTVGHAIERILDGGWTHGEAIGLGMRIEAMIAVNIGAVDQPVVDRINSILNLVNAPKIIPSSVEIHDIEKNISLDNKRNRDGVRFILPKKIGESQICSGIPQHVISDALAKFVAGNQ